MSQARTQAAGAPGGLRRSIGLGQGTALYVSAILGAGVLVLPGRAATLAGPGALMAWAFVCLLSVPLALTFAALATAIPDAGGVAAYAQRAFGAHAGGVVGWWYLLAGSLGQTVVALTGGYYLAAALRLDQAWAPPIAAGILAMALASNLAGTRVSARAQVGLALAVGGILLVAALSALPRADPAVLTDLAPEGAAGIGHAIVVLFFAFAGWEAIAHLASEFRDPARDLRRATTVTLVVVTLLYLAIATAVVLTGTYGTDRVDRLAIGLLLQDSLGLGAATIAGVAALVICLGTTNAFVASVARLAYALGRDGWLPVGTARVNHRHVPVIGVWLVVTISCAGLLLAWFFGWGAEQVVIVPSALVVVVYLVGTGAGIRLLHGWQRAGACMAFGLTLVTVPLAVGHLWVPVWVAVGALAFRALSRRPGAR